MSELSSYDVELDPSWSIGDKPHGGYLLRELVAPALDAAHPHPLAVSAHYVASPQARDARIEVERLRIGRRVASSRLRLAQDGAVKVEGLLSAGTLGGDAEPFFSSGAPPRLPPRADCPREAADRQDGPRVGQLDHVELRLDPATRTWAQDLPAGDGEVRGWLRRADGADADARDLLVFADALPPVTFGLGLPGWVPTVELTVLVRSLPAPGWLRGVQRTRLLRDGWLDEECEVWDSRDRLVVQARQLAGYRVPGGRSA